MSDPGDHERQPGRTSAEAWRDLRTHLEWSEGSWLGWIFTSDPSEAHALMHELRDFLAERGQTMLVVRPESPAETRALAEQLLHERTRDAACVWVEVIQGDISPFDQSAGPWTQAWDWLMLRCNEQRGALLGHLSGALLFVGSPAYKSRTRDAAPDLWTVRKLLLELEPRPGVPILGALPVWPVWPAGPAPDIELAEREAAHLARSGDQRGQTRALIRAAQGLTAAGRTTEAMARAQAAVDTAGDIPVLRLAALTALAHATFTHGEHDLAHEHARLAVDLATEHDLLHERDTDRAQWILAVTTARQGAWQAADDLVHAMLERARARAQARPDDLEAQEVTAMLLHTRAEFQLRMLETQATRVDQARACFVEELAIWEALLQANPSNTRWQRDLSVSLGRLGDLERSAGQLEQARAYFTRALENFEALAQADPINAEWQRDLSVSLERVGDLETRAGKLEQAHAYFTRSLEIREALAQADPTNTDWQRGLSVSLIKLGDLEMTAGHFERARAYFTHSLEIFEALAQADPSDAESQRNRSASMERLGSLNANAGQLEQARAYFVRSLENFEMLTQADPSNAGWQRDLSISLAKLGDLEARAGQLEPARAYFTRSLEILEALAQADPSNAGWQRDLIVPEMWLAELDAWAGRVADARAHTRAAREVLARLDAMGLLRGDALLEQYRAAIDAFEARLPAAPDVR